MGRSLPTKKEIYDTFKKKHNLTDKCNFKFENRKSLRRKDIYKIADDLNEYIQHTKKGDYENHIITRSKTWKRYIDCYEKLFNIDIHDTVSIPDGVLCACFISFLENPRSEYYKEMDEETEKKKKEIINKIKKCIKKEDATFEEELNYDEKNIVITELDKIFYSIDYEYFGIEDFFYKYEVIDGEIQCIIYDPSMEDFNSEKLHKWYRIKDMNIFKKRQNIFEMIAQIEPYASELIDIIDRLRMHTALEEMRTRFVENMYEVFAENMKNFLDNLNSEIYRKEKEYKLFNIRNESHYNTDVLKRDVFDTFHKYIEHEFDIFKENWIDECKNFDFDPYILIEEI